MTISATFFNMNPKTGGDMEYYDVDVYSLKVTTTSPEAQLWFDRGLVWCYAYFHDEAVACFERAIDADPSCAMAHWGVARPLVRTTTCLGNGGMPRCWTATASY